MGLKEYLAGFFGFSANFPDGNPGFAMQFWFVRDLMIFTVLMPAFSFFIRKFPTAFFCSVLIFYFCGSCAIDRHLPLALFFYTAGLYWGIYNVKIFSLADKIKWPEAVFLFALCFFFDYKFSEDIFFTPCKTLSACLVVLKFSGIICLKEKTLGAAAYLSRFSFWLYAIHMPALLFIIQKIWIKFFPMKNTFFSLAEYFGVNILIVVSGTLLGIALKKLCPAAFSLLSGKRS